MDLKKRARELLDSDRSVIPLAEFGDHFAAKAAQLAREYADERAEEIIEDILGCYTQHACRDEVLKRIRQRHVRNKPNTREQVLEEALRNLERGTAYCANGANAATTAAWRDMARCALEWKP